MAHENTDLAGFLDGDLIGKEVWDARNRQGHWTNLKGSPTDPWIERHGANSEWVVEDAPRWTTVTMVTHKKNRQVVLRTIVPEEGYLSGADLKFDPDDVVKFREKA